MNEPLPDRTASGSASADRATAARPGPAQDAAADLLACPDCATVQRVPPLPPGEFAICRTCDAPLERTAGRSAGAALACMLAALLLLIPGNLLPIMRSHLRTMAEDAYAIDGAIAFWRDGWPLLGILVALFVVGLPILRTGLLVAVLGSLRLGLRRPWQGRLFRHAEDLRLWSMPEVYLLAGIVTYSRVAAQLDIEVKMGGWCYAAAAILALIGEASMDRRRVWRALGPGSDPHGTVACEACGRLAAPGETRCRRCAHRLAPRNPEAMGRTVALTLAAFVLYAPAYFLPMTRTIRPDGITERSVLDGVSELFEKGFWYLGVLIFTVSVAIPLSKLLALTWLVLRVRFPARRRLKLRTKAYRAIHEINRWSFVDPFIVALTAPMMAYAGIADVHAGPGALPFALVVVLTMLASHAFDPRLMWDAAGGPGGQR
jgi:paraquat-inducible protein A